MMNVATVEPTAVIVSRMALVGVCCFGIQKPVRAEIAINDTVE